MSRRGTVERVRHRADGGLDVVRARNRTSAFVYGNITILGALVAVTPALVRDGQGLVVVAATAVTTFVAHLLADLVASRIGEQEDTEESRQELGDELRDSLPIVSSGAVPVVLFALAALGVLPAGHAQGLAAALVVVRLALTGLVVERISGRDPSALTWWSSLLLAVLGAGLAVAKAVLTH